MEALEGLNARLAELAANAHAEVNEPRGQQLEPGNPMGVHQRALVEYLAEQLNYTASSPVELELELRLLFYPPPREDLSTAVPLTLILGLLLVTGCVGNLCTAIVIARPKNKYMHTATNYYLFSLAMSDFLFLVLGLPQEMHALWHRYPYALGEWFCILRAFLSEASTCASILTISAFTVERYVAICHPLWAHTMSQLPRAVASIVIIWCLAAVCAVAPAAELGIVKQRSLVSNRVLEQTAQCIHKRSIYEHMFALSAIVFFILPMLIVTVLYILIALELRRSSKMNSAISKQLSSTTSAAPCHAHHLHQSPSLWSHRLQGDQRRPSSAIGLTGGCGGGASGSGRGGGWAGRLLVGWASGQALGAKQRQLDEQQQQVQQQQVQVQVEDRSTSCRTCAANAPLQRSLDTEPPTQPDAHQDSPPPPPHSPLCYHQSLIAHHHHQPHHKHSLQHALDCAHKHHRHAHRHAHRHHPHPHHHQHHRKSAPGSSKKSVVRMLVAVVVSFFICWLPFHAQRCLAIYLLKRKVDQPLLIDIYHKLTIVSGVTYYLSSTINPLLYQLMSAKFRLAFKETFNCSLLGCVFGTLGPTRSGSSQAGCGGGQSRAGTGAAPSQHHNQLAEQHSVRSHSSVGGDCCCCCCGGCGGRGAAAHLLAAPDHAPRPASTLAGRLRGSLNASLQSLCRAGGSPTPSWGRFRLVGRSRAPADECGGGCLACVAAQTQPPSSPAPTNKHHLAQLQGCSQPRHAHLQADEPPASESAATPLLASHQPSSSGPLDSLIRSAEEKQQGSTTGAHLLACSLDSAAPISCSAGSGNSSPEQTNPHLSTSTASSSNSPAGSKARPKLLARQTTGPTTTAARPRNTRPQQAHLQLLPLGSSSSEPAAARRQPSAARPPGEPAVRRKSSSAATRHLAHPNRRPLEAHRSVDRWRRLSWSASSSWAGPETGAGPAHLLDKRLSVSTNTSATTTSGAVIGSTDLEGSCADSTCHLEQPQQTGGAACDRVARQDLHSATPRAAPPRQVDSF